MQHTHLGVYGIINQDDRFLFIKKARGPYTNMYDLPGGKIEFGETPEQALIREIEEETGQSVIEYKLIFCDSVRFQHNVTGDKSIEDLHHIGIVYDIKIKSGIDIKSFADGLDSNGAFWFNPEKHDMENLTPFAKKAMLFQRNE